MNNIAEVLVRFFLPVMVTLIAAGCATLSQKDDNQQKLDLKITDSAPEQKPAVASTAQSGLVDYAFKKQNFKAEWQACVPDGSKATALLVDDLGAAFDGGGFCNDWLAQTFLAAGYAVILVNRPGYGRSTGAKDASGPHSQAAILAGAGAAQAAVKSLKPISGVWAFSLGVPAAAFVAKKLSGLRWAVFGAGIYDAEVTMNTTQDKKLRARIAAAGQDEDAYETRSIAWDNAGLPKKVILYHGKDDVAVLPAQVQSFRDSLATAEYDVTLQTIAGVSHEIPAATHRQIIEIVLRSLQ